MADRSNWWLGRRGYWLVDLDTIPVRLQQNLWRNARVKTSVYNFGIEGATISAELALLKQFKDVYSIDQVVFLTGGNDVCALRLSITTMSSGLRLGARICSI